MAYLTTTERRPRLERLERRLQDYHGVGIAEVLDVVGYLREDGDTVIAGGSLVCDLGNRLSDFDVVISGAQTSPSRVPLEHWVGSLRVDAWTRSHAGIDRLFTHAADALAGETPIQGVFGTVEEEQQLKLLHRVAFGLHLDGPELPGGTTGGRVALAKDLLVREYAERMRESALIAQLAARADRELAATTNARLAVEECLNAVLAFRGVPFTGDKWLTERLRGVAPLWDQYVRFRELPEGEVSGFVGDAVTLCVSLTGLDLTVEALSAALTWSVDGVSAQSAGGVDYLVAPRVGGLWKLESGEEATWRGLADRADDVGETGKLWQGGDCSAAETALLLGLYERGLATLGWSRGIPVADLEVAES